MPLPIYVSRNGALLPPAEATISVFNPALYGAYGVYESMEVVRGVPFALEAHLRRLAYSAELLKLPLPADQATFQRWIADVLAVNAVPQCTLRLFVVGGEDGNDAVAFIWPQAPHRYPRGFYVDGAPVVTFEGHRNLPQAKSLNTLVSYLAQRAGRAAGVHEALLYHGDFLTEGSNSNLFAVVDGAALTPPAEQVLSGVTRDLLMEQAARAGVPIREAPLALATLARWSECFITSSSRHVMPVTVIDGRPVGDGRVGPLTRRLNALFEEYFAQVTSVRSDARSC
ncbi:MAG: aminotransferase class IV [Chloroflexi bacterium]|nr:aminotransferase class IV [Chloroflexota bacterium]